jgi:hypothetical protein
VRHAVGGIISARTRARASRAAGIFQPRHVVHACMVDKDGDRERASGRICHGIIASSLLREISTVKMAVPLQLIKINTTSISF